MRILILLGCLIISDTLTKAYGILEVSEGVYHFIAAVLGLGIGMDIVDFIRGV